MFYGIYTYTYLYFYLYVHYIYNNLDPNPTTHRFRQARGTPAANPRPRSRKWRAPRAASNPGLLDMERDALSSAGWMESFRMFPQESGMLIPDYTVYIYVCIHICILRYRCNMYNYWFLDYMSVFGAWFLRPLNCWEDGWFPQVLSEVPWIAATPGSSRNCIVIIEQCRLKGRRVSGCGQRHKKWNPEAGWMKPSRSHILCKITWFYHSS